MIRPTGKSRPLVFLGPSLPRDEAETIIDAEFRPPARRGHLTDRHRGRLVVLIDGEFDQSFAVSPKEILRLIDSGTTVIGAASMGALRAAELSPMGMIGVGRIFEAYRSGEVEGDDEVAVSFCPYSGRSLTVPLVHVRFWLDELVIEGVLGEFTRAKAMRLARRIFYADRTPKKLRAALAGALGSGAWGAIRDSGFGDVPDVKADDARMALAAACRMEGPLLHEAR